MINMKSHYQFLANGNFKKHITKSRTCIVPGCYKPAIDCHSISQTHLRRISPSSHDIIYLGDPIIDGFDESLLTFKKSISSVSTFKGFCAYHDSTIFAPIENLGGTLLDFKNITKDHARLLSIKCLGLAWFKSKIINESLHSPKHNGYIAPNLKYEKYEELILDQIHTYLNPCYNKNIVYDIFDAKLPFKALCAHQNLCPFISLCSLPLNNNEQACFLIAQNKYDDEIMEAFVTIRDYIRQQTYKNDYSFIQTLILNYHNTCIDYESWNKLNSSRKQYYMKMFFLDHSLLSYNNNYIIQLILPKSF